MPRQPLITGSYMARSVIASAQRCVNLFMEDNPKDSAFPFTLYPTPGLVGKATAPSRQAMGWRQLYTSTNNRLYGVCGDTVYRIADDWTLTALGQIYSAVGYVSMVDNGVTMIIVDGSEHGYQVTIATDVMTPITDAGFYGGATVDFMDGYFIVNRPGTAQFFISGVNTASWDGLDFATKSANMDLLVGVGVSNRFLYLFGKTTTEIWFDSGDTAFPFARLSGAYMHYGCSAAGSIAQMDNTLYWLAQSEQGQAIICRAEKFQAVQVSTFALSNEISTYDRIDDAQGFCYQINGHLFYVINFPSANKSWQYDMSNGQWNELEWTDPDTGEANRHRAACHAVKDGRHVVGDWQNGKLYDLTLDSYDDDGDPIVHRRSWYHGVDGNYYRVSYLQFTADMETGNGNAEEVGGNVDIFMRWSDTRGKSWGNPIKSSLGLEGEYIKTVNFKRLGAARDRVFEVFWSTPVRTALQGAYVDFNVNNR